MVVEVPLHHTAQPLALPRDRLMTPTRQFLLHLFQLGSEPLGRRLPLHDKPSLLERPPTDVSEAQEGEGLWLAIPSLPSVLGGEPPEFDQSRFLGVQGQAELLKPFPQFSEEPFGLTAVLEPNDKIIGVAHDDQVACGGLGPPLLDP